jgi:hypothetical protein
MVILVNLNFDPKINMDYFHQFMLHNHLLLCNFLYILYLIFFFFYNEIKLLNHLLILQSFNLSFDILLLTFLEADLLNQI